MPAPGATDNRKQKSPMVTDMFTHGRVVLARPHDRNTLEANDGGPPRYPSATNSPWHWTVCTTRRAWTAARNSRPARTTRGVLSLRRIASEKQHAINMAVPQKMCECMTKYESVQFDPATCGYKLKITQIDIALKMQ